MVTRSRARKNKKKQKQKQKQKNGETTLFSSNISQSISIPQIHDTSSLLLPPPPPPISGEEIPQIGEIGEIGEIGQISNGLFSMDDTHLKQESDSAKGDDGMGYFLQPPPPSSTLNGIPSINNLNLSNIGNINNINNLSDIDRSGSHSSDMIGIMAAAGPPATPNGNCNFGGFSGLTPLRTPFGSGGLDDINRTVGDDQVRSSSGHGSISDFMPNLLLDGHHHELHFSQFDHMSPNTFQVSPIDHTNVPNVDKNNNDGIDSDNKNGFIKQSDTINNDVLNGSANGNIISNDNLVREIDVKVEPMEGESEQNHILKRCENPSRADQGAPPAKKRKT